MLAGDSADSASAFFVMEVSSSGQFSCCVGDWSCCGCC